MNTKAEIELRTAKVFRALDEANLDAAYSRMAVDISCTEALRGVERTLPPLDRDKAKFVTLHGRSVALFEDDGSPFRGKTGDHNFGNAVRLTGSSSRHAFVVALPARKVEVQSGEFVDRSTKVSLDHGTDYSCVVQLPDPIELLDPALPFSLQASILMDLSKGGSVSRRQAIETLKSVLGERIMTSLPRRAREPDFAVQAAIALEILGGDRSPFPADRRASLALEAHGAIHQTLPSQDIHLKIAEAGMIPLDLFERATGSNVETLKTKAAKEKLTLTGLETVFRMRQSARLRDSQSSNLLRTFFQEFRPLKTWKHETMSFSIFELEEGCVIWERDLGTGDFFLTTWKGSARETESGSRRFIEFPDIVARDQLRYAHARILRFADASLFRTKTGEAAFIETFEHTRKVRTGYLRPRSSITKYVPFEDRRAATLEGRDVFICEDDLSPIPASETIDLSRALHMPGAGNRIALPGKDIGLVGVDDEESLVLPMMAPLLPEAMKGLIAVCGNFAFSVDDPLDVRIATLFHATSPSASRVTISAAHRETLLRHLKATMRALLRQDRKSDTLSREIVSARKFTPQMEGLVDPEEALRELIQLRAS